MENSTSSPGRPAAFSGEPGFFAAEFSTVYTGSPWYGKPIFEVLKDISHQTAFARPLEKAHSIAELLAHMIAWRQVLINSLEKNGRPKPKQAETFMPHFYGDNEESMWRNMKDTLESQYLRIQQLLTKQGGEAKEARGFRGKRFPLKLINGVVQHDIYHLGQISMLKKSLQR